MGQQPNSKLIPVGATATVAGNVFVDGNPFCMIGWFGRAVYRLLTKHLDW
jgi:hypothetical protein